MEAFRSDFEESQTRSWQKNSEDDAVVADCAGNGFPEGCSLYIFCGKLVSALRDTCIGQLSAKGLMNSTSITLRGNHSLRCYVTIYICSNLLCLASVEEPVNECLLGSVLSILFDQMKPTEVVGFSELLLSSLPNCGYSVSDLELRGRLYSACTSCWSDEPNCFDAERLPLGNAIIGLEAGVLAYAEARNLKAFMFFSLRNAAASMEAMKIFEDLLPFLAGKLGISTSTTVDKTIYKRLTDRDAFVFKTSNLYC